MINFCGYTVINGKDGRKWLKCCFYREMNTATSEGLDVFTEFMPFDSKVCDLVGQTVTLSYDKDYRGRAVLVGMTSERG